MQIIVFCDRNRDGESIQRLHHPNQLSWEGLGVTLCGVAKSGVDRLVCISRVYVPNYQDINHPIIVQVYSRFILPSARTSTSSPYMEGITSKWLKDR